MSFRLHARVFHGLVPFFQLKNGSEIGTQITTEAQAQRNPRAGANWGWRPVFFIWIKELRDILKLGKLYIIICIYIFFVLIGVIQLLLCSNHDPLPIYREIKRNIYPKNEYHCFCHHYWSSMWTLDLQNPEMIDMGIAFPIWMDQLTFLFMSRDVRRFFFSPSSRPSHLGFMKWYGMPLKLLKLTPMVNGMVCYADHIVNQLWKNCLQRFPHVEMLSSRWSQLMPTRLVRVAQKLIRHVDLSTSCWQIP